MQSQALWTLLPLVLLLGSCSSTPVLPSGDAAVDIAHPDPRIRIQATRMIADQKIETLIPKLLAGLSDRDASVRFFSAIALRQMSAREFGFQAHATLPERRAAIERWTAWAKSEGHAP